MCVVAINQADMFPAAADHIRVDDSWKSGGFEELRDTFYEPGGFFKGRFICFMSGSLGSI